MEQLEQLRRRVLVLKCQLGDQGAWDELYRLYNPSLGYYLRRLTGRDQTAVDVQQEVWLAVVRNITRLKYPEAFTVWFYRIARSKVMSRLSAHDKDLSLEEAPESPADEPDDEAFRAGDAARVHAALDGLGPEHREVLLLRFMEDLSYEQIAEVVGRPVGTVRSRIHHAKHALRRQLENDHE